MKVQVTILYNIILFYFSTLPYFQAHIFNYNLTCLALEQNMNSQGQFLISFKFVSNSIISRMSINVTVPQYLIWLITETISYLKINSNMTNFKTNKGDGNNKL